MKSPIIVESVCRCAPVIAICLLLLFSWGCTRNYDGDWNIPFVYKIDIQQGNVVDQAMLDKLQQGMDKTQVRFIMGTPLLIDPFHNNRWEYIFSYQKGGKEREQRHISLYFEDEKLAYIKGDVQTSLTRRSEDELKEAKSVVVPLSDKKEKGVIGRMFEKINPFSDKAIQNQGSEPTDPNPKDEKNSEGELK